MRLRLLVATACAALSATPALAQDPGTEVGGDVPDVLQLSIADVEGFASFSSGPAERTLTVPIWVTSTGARAVVTMEDGDGGTGRMTSGSSALRLPVERRVSGAFAPLSAASADPLAVFTQPVSNAPVRIRLRQRIAPGERPSGTYEKSIFITLSTSTP
jgi:hypothetical protein